jgi:superfamily II DNA/RNA helicase
MALRALLASGKAMDGLVVLRRCTIRRHFPLLFVSAAEMSDFLRPVTPMPSPGVVFRPFEDLKPVITIPVELQKRALKRQERLKREKIRKNNLGINDGDRLRCIIKCRVKELDHFAGQTYDRYKSIRLASEHWRRSKTNGDFFSFNGYKSPSYKIKERKALFTEHEDLDARLIASLADAGFRRLTYVQDQSIPAVLMGKSMIIASETGNGKTLAYLVPIIQKVLEAKEAQTEPRKKNSPIAVVVTPGRELAEQIRDVAKSICEPLGLDVGFATGGSITRKLTNKTIANVDILVGSFGGLNQLFRGNLYTRESLKHIVYDEADTLLDDTFNRQSVPLITFLSGKLGDSQLLLVGATFPTNLEPLLDTVIDSDELEKITTNYLHMVPPHIHQTFMRMPKLGKENYLLDTIEKDVAKGHPIVIFSNTAPTSMFVKHFLDSHKIPCVTLNSHTDTHERRENLRRFFSGEVKVLSCTDLASRGIDTSNAMHVVNYDFPLNMADYIHRLGRVGRVSSPAGSKATHLVGGTVQVKLVQDIEMAVRTRKELKAVNNNIIRIIQHRAEMTKEREAMAAENKEAKSQENHERKLLQKKQRKQQQHESQLDESQ